MPYLNAFLIFLGIILVGWFVISSIGWCLSSNLCSELTKERDHARAELDKHIGRAALVDETTRYEASRMYDVLQKKLIENEAMRREIVELRLQIEERKQAKY